MLHEQVAAGMGIDVGGVGYVVTFPLQETEHVVFVVAHAKELSSAAAVLGKGSIERDMEGAGPTVQRISTSGVIGLEGGNAGLEQQVGRARVLAQHENDVAFLAAAKAGQFREIDATGPIRGIGRLWNVYNVRIRPVAFHQAGTAVKMRRRLNHSRADNRADHPPAACAPVPSHPEDFNRVARVGRVNKNRDVLAAIDAGGGGIALDFTLRGGIRERPVRGAGLAFSSRMVVGTARAAE